MNIIFVPTVQHTGTWFCLQFLLHHSAVQNVLDMHMVKECWPDGGMVLISAHMCGVMSSFPCTTERGVNPTDIHKHHPIEAIEDLINGFPSVSTVRDPLLSLVTRQIRHPEFDHFYIVDGFVELAGLVERTGLMLLSPDLGEISSYKVRLKMLRQVLDAVGLPDESYVRLWATVWPVFNSTVEAPERVLHDAYDRRDLDILREAFPEEYDYLKSKENMIRPFLESVGYKNLMWWG